MRSSRLTLQPPRYNVDAWDQMMMERDRRLTGSARGQSVSRELASPGVSTLGSLGISNQLQISDLA